MDAACRALIELEETLATKVFRWRRHDGFWVGLEGATSSYRCRDENGIPGERGHTWMPAVDMSDAWPLLLSLPEPPPGELPPESIARRTVAQLSEGNFVAGWEFTAPDGKIRWYGPWLGQGATAPEAICRCRLLAAQTAEATAPVSDFLGSTDDVGPVDPGPGEAPWE
jgi:hypothetical protein